MKPLFKESIAKRIEASGIVAVVVIDRVEHAVPLARTLLATGVDVMELTLRTPTALPALATIVREVPEMLVGAGTVTDVDQVSEAVEAGAAFGVAPGTNRKVLAAAREAGLSFAPGVLTPSDIEQAMEEGCRLLKFFPAEIAGGLEYIRMVTGPYAHLGLRLIPLGGLNATNMLKYLGDPLVLALGGSWLAPRELIQAEDWPQITQRVLQATQAIQQQRSSSNPRRPRSY